MYRSRLSLAFAVLVALVFIQAAFVYWGANRVDAYARHSRLASDILAELLDLSAGKQRLRVWASQQLMGTAPSPQVRDGLLAAMRSNARTLTQLARRDAELWTEVAANEDPAIPADIRQLMSTAELLDENIAAVQLRLAQLVALDRGADFTAVWRELNDVFDRAQGRDLREAVNGAIERQRKAVPLARAATERGLDRVRLQAIAMAGLVLAAAVVLALHLNRRLQRPLEGLLEGTKALQAGALEHRIAHAGKDEFDRLAAHFNTMATQLQQHRSEADAARHRLEDAVQERTQELTIAHSTLQRIDQRRRQLFADLGHELRTPVTAIRGEAEIALRGAHKPVDEYRQTLTRIVGGVQQLTGVVDDLLLLAKAEADQLVMRPVDVELHVMLADAVDTATALGARHDVRVMLADARAPAAHLMADADRLRQAFVIVLDNAVRYSRQGGDVRVAWRVTDGRAEVVVADDGIGIDADELPLVFERFVRGRRAREHRADGSGIGLSIAQAIVQAHHGRIAITSRPQQGTEVCIELPCLHVAIAEARA
ncbi:MAG TPA: ATP-binding protein [Burkholderiaceae bacterium]|nr:ATP-binding protein [Burkholderiaceae bacterium]